MRVNNACSCHQRRFIVRIFAVISTFFSLFKFCLQINIMGLRSRFGKGYCKSTIRFITMFLFLRSELLPFSSVVLRPRAPIQDRSILGGYAKSNNTIFILSRLFHTYHITMFPVYYNTYFVLESVPRVHTTSYVTCCSFGRKT